MSRFLSRTILALSLSGLSLYSSAFAQRADTVSAATDAFGDPLPDGAMTRIGTTRFRYAAPVTALTFSPDGKRIAATSQLCEAAVWDARTGRTLAFHNGFHQQMQHASVVSPDGSLFAGQHEFGEFFVRQALDGKVLHRFKRKDQYIQNLVFSRGNRWLATADSSNISLWDLQAGRLVHQFEAIGASVYGGNDMLAFTPDAKTLIHVREDAMFFWSVETGKEIRRIKVSIKNEWYLGTAVSPNGEILATNSYRDRMDLWEIKTGRRVSSFEKQYSSIGPIFSPDGKQLITGRNTGEINFWNIETGKIARTLNLPKERHAQCFAFSPDGKILACGGFDHVIHLFDLASGKEVSPVTSEVEGVPSVHFLTDGKTLVTRWRSEADWHNIRVSLWDLQGKLVRQSKVASFKADGYVLSNDAHFIALEDGSSECPNGFPLGNAAPSDKTNSTLRICDAETGKQLIKINDLPFVFDELAFSPDNRVLLANARKGEGGFMHQSKSLQIWNRKAPDRLEKIADIPVRIHEHGCGLSPDGRWVAVTAEKGCSIYECELGKLLRSYPDVPGWVYSVSSNGRVLVSRNVIKAEHYLQEVIIWEKATGKTICKLDCKDKISYSAPIVVSPDGIVVAGCMNEETISLWDACTGKELGRLQGHRGCINSLCFSADGRFLVSASADTTILIWDWRKKLPKPSANEPLSAERLAELSKDLQANDAQRAYRAIRDLVQSPGQAIDLVKKTTRGDNAKVRSKIKQWIVDLDNDEQAVRENATKGLVEVGELAEFVLLKSLREHPALEVEHRITIVLEQLTTSVPRPLTLGILRAQVLLEMINTPEALDLLRELCAGDAARLPT